MSVDVLIKILNLYGNFKPWYEISRWPDEQETKLDNKKQRKETQDWVGKMGTETGKTK